jgi:Peptidase family M1 domain
MQFRVLIPVFFLAVGVCAQTAVKPIEPNGAARPANSEKTYAALRADMPNGESATVKDFSLAREGGVFHFDQGNFYLYTPVGGRVTGAVFVGKGRFELTVKSASEQRSLALLTKSAGMTQDFTTLVLRFTDGTAEEIRKASAGAAGEPDGHVRSAAEDLAKTYRKDMSDNIELRMLADMIGGGEGQFFLASFRMGNMLTGRNVLFVVDPEGTFHSSPDQVELTTWSDVELQTWAAYRMQHTAESSGKRVQVTDESLDVSIDRGAMMKVSAETTMKVLRDGVRVIHLNLYPTLRVSGVYSESGAPLDFVQEDKKLDPEFGVILPEAAKKGDTLRLLTVYSGNDALRAEGNETYYLMPGARASWYPSGEGGMGDFANFHMTFHIPKNLQIVATGNQVTLTPDTPGITKAVWETVAPIPVAGFNLGDFKRRDDKTPKGFGVSAYASVGNATSTETGVQALPNEVSQGMAAIQIYSDYFGKLPYDHVALTPQPTCSYGQSWPMLVYLPACAFWDSTALQANGLLDLDANYWKEVTPHEVSHQWWGSLVGFKSYRDQWMSEGFANFSVGVFLLNTSPKIDQYRAFWKEQQQNLLEKNTEGKRPIDVGTLTMGGRVSNEKNGNVYQMLIYSKGAYVLHMLEMQFWTPQEQGEPFKRAMQQFVNDYSGKAATTEDWKASMEKSMPKSLDLRGDGKLDWFFDEFVYGTELPHYSVSSDFSVGADGVTSAHLKITQSNVSNNFVMRVPVYMQLQDGATKRIFNAVMHGNATIDQTVKLPGKFPSPPKAILVNYNADVLSDN